MSIKLETKVIEITCGINEKHEIKLGDEVVCNACYLELKEKYQILKKEMVKTLNELMAKLESAKAELKGDK